MFAVEVLDAQGRVVPVANNDVTFRVTGKGKLIGVGNGDPTDHDSDKGTSRKAFSGLCMALVQSTKTAGDITVEVVSPGLTAARVAIQAKAATLRPQVSAWKREVPVGSGITGLWRPMPAAGSDAGLLSLVAGSSLVFSLQQDGSTLKGSVEGAGGGFFGGGDMPSPIVEGKVEGDRISFKSGNSTFEGTLKGDRIELQRSIDIGFRLPNPPKEPTGGPAIGPPPDGSDPSISSSWRLPRAIPVVLHRVQQ